MTAQLPSKWSDADQFYAQLLDAHNGLTNEQSQALNARLILLLANQIGEMGALSACILLAQNPESQSNL